MEKGIKQKVKIFLLLPALKSLPPEVTIVKTFYESFQVSFNTYEYIILFPFFVHVRLHYA